jgi:ABC-type polysaccharide/polyol phosphate transport system ATPase subunit
MIRAHDISKTFLIPKEKKMTLREHVLGYLRGRTTGYEPLRALRGVSFDVHKGEFFSIIGKNGSGKSTLLKIMSSIYAPDGGGVALDGTVSPFLELGIGFNPDLTARDNVYLSAAVLGLRRKEIDSLYGGIIGFAELERFQEQALKNFSSGMKVRLAFSVAFMVDADILLIDEVLAVGDASFQQKCYDVFRRLKGEGKTIIFVSHSMGDIKEFSDRVMLLHEGRVVSLGAPEKVIHDYQLLTAHEDEKRIAMAEGARAQESAGPRKEFAAPGSDRRWGSGGASVERISFADAGGRGKHVFATGEEVRARLEFRVDREGLAPARLIVAIHRSDGVTVMETRSGPITRAGTGARLADLVFPRIELLAGTYYFDVGLAPGEGGADPYDFVKNCGSIRVYQDSKSVYHDATGLCALAHDWRVG